MAGSGANLALTTSEELQPSFNNSNQGACEREINVADQKIKCQQVIGGIEEV